VARTRTTKKLAQRIDLNYFKRPTSLKRAKLWLSILLPLLALIWIAERTFSKDSRVYSSGRMSEAHAVLEKECATCHVQQAGAFSAKAADTACLSCHDGPIHHANQVKSLECSSCHTEHRGRVSIVAASNQSCAECHGDLKANSGSVRFASHIHSFEDGHPQFAALREGARDPGTIKLNHAIHMKPIRKGPTGAAIQLSCENCHRTSANIGYCAASATSMYAGPVPCFVNDLRPVGVEPGSLLPPRPDSGRERMAIPKFAAACADCHALTFDKRFEEGVPHDKPQVVHAFVVKKFTDYIAAHPAELSEMRDPGRELTGKVLSPRTQTLTPSQWIAEHTEVAEQLLWRKTCKQCHALTSTPLLDTTIARWDVATHMDAPRASTTAIVPPSNSLLPVVASSNTIARWMPHAKFAHSAHTGFTCASCHEKALTSVETGDVLLPGIATCQTCHAPGPDHAESRCFECHTYHDWSKRKEVKPSFTLPALRTGKGGR
jgi:hypothetical protein